MGGDFNRLWAAQTISLLGSEVSTLAIPLTAVLTLGASPAQMGLLIASQQLPWLAVGLFAGAWVDRLRRRPILIAADVGRAVLLVSIPVAAVLGALTIWQLYAVAFLVGTLSVFFNIAYQSYLPSLVSKEHLAAANSRLEASRSTVELLGPAGAGALVQALKGPFAIVLDSLSFLFSALFLRLIRREEPPPEPRPLERRIWGEIGEGLAVLARSPVQRSIAGSGTIITLFWSAQEALFVLYATRELGLSPATLGLVLTAAAPGALVGAALAARAARRFGTGRTIFFAYLLDSIALLLLPFAAIVPGPQAVVIAFLIAAEFALYLGSIIYAVNGISLIQTITPDHLLGRVNASRRFFIQGSMPIGALLGGLLGGAIGLAPTLLLAAVGSFLAALWVLLSPLYAARIEESEPEDNSRR